MSGLIVYDQLITITHLYLSKVLKQMKLKNQSTPSLMPYENTIVLKPYPSSHIVLSNTQHSEGKEHLDATKK